MLLTLLFSFHKHLTGVKGRHISGLMFACPPMLFAISVTRFWEQTPSCVKYQEGPQAWENPFLMTIYQELYI